MDIKKILEGHSDYIPNRRVSIGSIGQAIEYKYNINKERESDKSSKEIVDAITNEKNAENDHQKVKKLSYDPNDGRFNLPWYKQLDIVKKDK